MIMIVIFLFLLWFHPSSLVQLVYVKGDLEIFQIIIDCLEPRSW